MDSEPLRSRRDYGASDSSDLEALGINPYLNIPPTELDREVPKEKDPKKKKELQDALYDWRITQPNPLLHQNKGKLMENNDEVIASILSIAKELIADDVATNSPVTKTDPQLNQLAQKVSDATGGDLGRMLTLVVMALKKSGNTEAASKIIGIFKTIDKKFDKIIAE